MNEIDAKMLAREIALAISNPDIALASKVRNPYRQFPFTIAAGAIETIYYTFDFWRMLTLSNTTGVQLRFGKTGSFTDIVGAGVGNRLPDPVGEIQIINNSGSTITGVIGLAVGDIFDDRLNISGALNVAVPSNFESVDDITLAAATATDLSVANANKKEVFITNVSCPTLRISGDGLVAADHGTPVAVGQTIIISTSGLVEGFSTAGGDVAVSETVA